MNTIREQLNIYEQEIDQIKEQSRIKVRIKSIIYFLINKDFCQQNIKIRNSGGHKGGYWGYLPPPLESWG